MHASTSYAGLLTFHSAFISRIHFTQRTRSLFDAPGSGHHLDKASQSLKKCLWKFNEFFGTGFAVKLSLHGSAFPVEDMVIRKIDENHSWTFIQSFCPK